MRPGWPVLRKLWHIETTPFMKFMRNVRKWRKAHSRTSPSNIHSEIQKLRRQNANVLRSQSGCCPPSHMIVEFPKSRHMYALCTYFSTMLRNFTAWLWRFSQPFKVFLCILFIFFFYRYSTRTYRSTRIDITEFTTITLITNYKEKKERKKKKKKEKKGEKKHNLRD